MGFDLLKLNMFQGGIFKQAKYMVSTPQRAHKAMYISETGTITQELLPMFTGFLSAEGVKKTWTAIHFLKFSVTKKGQPVQDEQVLLISDRSYIPLDPNNKLTEKARKELASLKEIARIRHAIARSDAGKDSGKTTDLAQLIITGSFILWAIMVVAALVRAKWGG